MAFRYFRTMCLQVGEDADLTLCEAPSRYYTPMLLRSKARLTMDEGLTLYARVASAAPAARFKREYRKIASAGGRRSAGSVPTKSASGSRTTLPLDAAGPSGSGSRMRRNHRGVADERPRSRGITNDIGC
jgi:hypothetical protein